jgi:ABC-type transport system substrate-binding protein
MPMKTRLFAVLLLCSALAWTQSVKVVRAGIHTDIKTTDPRKAIDSFSTAVMSNVFETLVAFEMTGTKMIPCLATSWSSDAAFRTWTYTLRPGVRFHDGSPLTPDAVVKSFAGVPNFPHKVRALGEDKVVFSLSTPDSNFNQFIAQPYYFIVSPKILSDAALVSGTGPFLFTSWEKGKLVILKKNPNYWQKPAVLDEVRFVVYPGQAALLKALAAGEIDMVEFLVGNNLKAIKANPNLTVESIMGNSTGFLSINTRRVPFNDVRVRRAVAMALNPFELTKKFFVGSAGAPATSMIPPTLFSYFSKIAVNRPEEAKALLNASGWDATKTYVLLEGWAQRPYMPDPHGIALEIQKQLDAVGIRVRLERDPENYFDRLAKGEFDLVLNGWIADSPNPAEYLTSNLQTRTIGQNNASQWSNATFDAIVDSCRILGDKELQAKLREALRIVDEEVPLIALFYGPQTAVLSNRIKNYHIHPFAQFYMYTVSLAAP